VITLLLRASKSIDHQSSFSRLFIVLPHPCQRLNASISYSHADYVTERTDRRKKERKVTAADGNGVRVFVADLLKLHRFVKDVDKSGGKKISLDEFTTFFTLQTCPNTCNHVRTYSLNSSMVFTDGVFFSF